MDSPLLCPNCHSPVGAGVPLCPNCGASMPLPPTPGQAPLPGAFGMPTPPATRLLTGNAAFDFILGVLATVASVFVAGLGILVMPILYFVLRPTVPVFARGVGYSLIFVGVLLLGAFAFCLFGLSSSGH